MPDFIHEKTYWSQDISYVAGIDEAGMGALAGPVIAAAVVFNEETGDIKVQDSKKLTPTKRENLVPVIKERAAAWAIGEASVEEIARLNIRAASHLAMRRAINALSVEVDVILLDGTPAQPHPHIFAVNIIGGDNISTSIAAASILAKVHRDKYMAAMSDAFPMYGFASHKGYGSKYHMDALKQYGPSPHHRTTYAPVARLLTK